MATGEDSGVWGQTTNSNWSPLIESAICGVYAVSFGSDANLTLAINNGSDSSGRYYVLACTSSVSLSTTRELICPLVNKTYIVQNSTTGGQSITVIGASGTGVTIPNGMQTLVYSDGTNYYQGINWFTGLTLVSPTITGATINGLTITSSTGTLTIANGKTFTSSNSLTLAGTDGKTLTISNSLTLAGTDSTTMTFPTTSATIARTDASNTFTGHQTIEGVTSTGATGTGNFVFSASPTLTGTLTCATVTTSGNLTLSGSQLALQFASSGWSGGGTAYFQGGVNNLASSSGNSLTLLLPTNKTFSVADNSTGQIFYANVAQFVFGSTVIPTSDPHLVGQVWANSGILTLSAG